MKLLIIKTGETQDVPDGYGMRLIEQGRAVIAPKPEKKAEPKPEDPKPKKG